MIDLEAFLPQILPYAQGCPVSVAYDHIRSAAQRFCERTRMWRETVTVTIDAVENGITVSNGAALYEIEKAFFGTSEIRPVSPSDLDALYAGWRDGTEASAPAYITQTAPNTVRLVPYAVGDVTLNLFIKPSEDCTQLPDFMGEQYKRVIADGALAEILILPKQNFSDPSRAAFFEARFMRELDRLSGQHMKGQQRAPVRTRARFF